jgi:formylglycine-generating enzyme
LIRWSRVALVSVSTTVGLWGCTELKQWDGAVPADAGTDADTGCDPTVCVDAAPDAELHCAPGFAPAGEECVPSPPSCAAVPLSCADDDSCCNSRFVEGGSYGRSWDQSDKPKQPGDELPIVGWVSSGGAETTVSDFWLDRYEVTVGRFRAFTSSYDEWRASGNPKSKAASHYRIPDSGWRSSWTLLIPETRADLLDGVAHGSESTCPVRSWTDAPDTNEDLPMVCVTWWEAFLFCMWDGGRLPTEAEWNYAAAGGGLQRAFPWSDSPASVDISFTDAVFDKGSGFHLAPVGSVRDRDGFYGQRDLAGNAWEWVLDPCNADQCTPFETAPPYPTGCSDCLVPFAEETDAGPAVAQAHMCRGGSWKYPPRTLRTAYRLAGVGAENRYDDLGFRCARNPAAK